MQDYAAEGKSLAKVEGKVIFIENVVPGDVVDVQLLKSKKDWGEGRPIKFHAFSEDRLFPFAPILVFAVVVNGKCCRMKSSWSTSNAR